MRTSEMMTIYIYGIQSSVSLKHPMLQRTVDSHCCLACAANNLHCGLTTDTCSMHPPSWLWSEEGESCTAACQPNVCNPVEIANIVSQQRMRDLMDRTNTTASRCSVFKDGNWGGHPSYSDT